MPIELTIIIKDEEKTLKQKFLSYNSINLNTDDSYLKECVDNVIKQFMGTPEDIIIKTNMIWK
jgi:hypothetical protein